MLNLEVSFMEGKLASCENLIKEFWNILEPKINSLNFKASLHQLRLYETSRNFVNYYGEKEITS
ncbi:MAG: 6-carboxytetrahydropterin synthase [Ekhidna sp.]|nr:6-carboxytetrahydropterin synthase [Ekhidna sp.]MBC6409168.1 6-carboxytetrahydropterin synthase [Ekhidna sp.]MBC6426340.1 6-carboxytetrahydropterin synthase [Ekhidna sp.]